MRHILSSHHIAMFAALAMAKAPPPCSGPHKFSEPVGRLRMKVCEACGALEKAEDDFPDVDIKP